MISRENQFDVVFNKMYYGTGSGTLPVIEDVDWMRENVSAETKGKRARAKGKAKNSEAAQKNTEDAADDDGENDGEDDEGEAEDILEEFKGTFDSVMLADREQYVEAAKLLRSSVKVITQIEEAEDIGDAKVLARSMKSLFEARLDEIQSTEATYHDERDELYSNMPSNESLSNTIGVLDSDSDEDHEPEAHEGMAQPPAERHNRAMGKQRTILARLTSGEKSTRVHAEACKAH